MTRTSFSLLLLVALLPLTVQAQPQTEQAAAAQRDQAQQAALWSWRDLQREMAPQELSAPARAIAAYQKFYEESGHLSLEVSVGVTSRIAQLWARELKNPSKAGEIYAWALEQWGETPYKERLQREAEAIRALGQTPKGDGKVVEAGVAPVGVAPVGVTPFGATLAPVKVGALGVKPVGTKPVGVAAVGGALVAPELMSPVKSKSPFELLSPFAGVDVSSTGAANLSAVGGGNVALRVALEEMHAGRLSAQDAGKRGALSVDDAVRLLEQTGEWGNVDGRKDEPLRRDLGLFVVQQAPHLLQEPDKLPMPVRLWIADALSGERDLRGVPLFESVLRELKARGAISTEREAGAVFLASERLAWLYRDTDQHEKEIQTWLELPQLLEGTPLRERTRWMLPDALLGAARAYNQAGQNDKAKMLYSQIPQYGHGWFSGVAIYDQANTLISKGKHQEARKLLSRPIKGVGADQVGIALLSLQALSYYKTGELEAANRTAQQAVTQAAVTKFSSGKGLEATINSAQAIQSWSEQWNKAPILMSSENLRLVLAPQESNEKTVTRYLFVRTLRDVPLVATIDDARIQVRVTGNKRENDYYVQKELVLEVPQSLSQSVSATLTVSSSLFPSYQAQMPFHIEVPRPIQLSSSNVFFGEIKADEPTTRKLTLSAAMPFRVLDVKADTAALEVQSPAPQAAREQTLTLIFTAPQAGRFYNGTIRIQTDLPNEEVIEVPYVAHAR